MNNDLLTAIDAITQTVKVTNRLGEDQAGKWVVHRREDKPPLVQLREAIHSNIGGSGGGKQARERTPLDVGAFQLYETIDGRIRAWLLDAGETADGSSKPEDLLRHWYVIWMAKTPADGLVDRHATIVEGWGKQITDHLDPPTRQELTVACPVCGNMWATVGQGEETESVRALWAVWHDNPDDSYGMCRACDKVWKGVPQMRNLRIAIDEVLAEKESA